MAEVAALGAVATYIGYAYQAYGSYNSLFGPAEHEIDWNTYILASEKRIIAASKEQEFKSHTRKLRALGEWWNRDCVQYLKDHPISPKNLEAFKSKVNPTILDINIDALRQLVEYFVRDAPGDYATYLALVTVYTLLHIFLCVRETYYVAANIQRTKGLIPQTIQDGMNAIKAWPARYYTERASHMTVEIEMKYKGGGGILGSAGQKRVTGWYIVHDSATDPAVSTFNNVRFEHQFPNTAKIVAERYAGSEMAKVTVPKLLFQWLGLWGWAVKVEMTPVAPAPKTSVDPDTIFEATRWWRLKNFSPPYNYLDLAPPTSTDPQLSLNEEADVPSQLWQTRHSTSNPGLFNFCTLAQGTGLCLDVYGDDKTRPHLATAGFYSGQQWTIIDRHDGTWSLANSYSGPDMYLDVVPDGSGKLCLGAKQEESKTQRWLFSNVRPVTEAGF